MSSRNLRLNEEERKKAPAIFKVLHTIKALFKTGDIQLLKENAKQELIEAGFKVDYIEIAEASNLRIAANYETNKTYIALVAAFLNEVRLIDNLILNDVN